MLRGGGLIGYLQGERNEVVFILLHPGADPLK